MTHLKCPTCERSMRPPRAWYSGWWIWAYVVSMSSAVAWIILDPPASEIASCVKYAKAGAGSVSSCYAPHEPWLALGWACYAGLLVLVALMVRSQALRARRERRAWPRIEERLVPDEMRPKRRG